jgi:nicotinamidase-related amidase
MWRCYYEKWRQARRHTDMLILTGAETDVCVLSTALGAIDHGYRVIITEDGVCSSSDQGHDFAARFIRATLQSANRGRRYANNSKCVGYRVKHSR